MLDRYYLGEVRRVSPEAPVQVVNIAAVDDRPGGAANVAVNAGALGVSVTLLGLVGADNDARLLAQLLDERGIKHRLIAAPGSPTTVKSRVVSRGQQLLRLDFEEGSFPDALRADLAQAFDALLADAHAVVLSDYAKGCLGDVERLIAAADAAGKLVFVDPKRADFSCYRGAHVVTPNFSEFVKTVGACADEREVERRMCGLREQFDFNAVLVTRGSEGMSLAQADGVVHLPPEAQEVYDVTGAGDTVIATLASAFCAGAPLVEAARLANSAAATVVEKSGTVAISLEDLRRSLSASRISGGVCDEETLLQFVGQARRQGEVIVMTNGCFDILHAGHVDYLTQAASLGDRLVVAVNEDASVTRIKGQARPINRLPERMRVLAALEVVDWVVPFPEDTPQRMIELVNPDVLVKGGDYRAEEVVGYDHVIAAGGRVVILDFLEGFSTSGLIADILRSH